MKKISIFILLIFLSYFPQNSYSQKRAKQSGTHRWSVSTSLLVQNNPFLEFALFENNAWYATQFDIWRGGDAGIGLGVGFAYDYTMKNLFMFRIQGQLESTGWISGIIDLGIGVRVPITKKFNISIETYFSISQTGGTLGQVGIIDTTLPTKQSLYMGLFGFKGRIAFEFAISKNYFIAPFISYAAYPWKSSNLDNIHINGFEIGAVPDSFNIGLEFGSKF